MKTYHGSCHCGAVKFEIDADLSKLARCICSICSKKGALFCYVPPHRFHLLQGQDALTLYRFNTEVSQHLFCKHCGIHGFGRPRSAPEEYVINVRCLDDFDLETESYEIKTYDGRDWQTASKARLEDF